MSAVNPTATNFIPNAAENAKKTRVKDGGDTAAEQKEMFLKLMIAQLRNQDPSSPMDQKDMMAGITQMTQVEQFMNMSKSMESLALSQGVGMVGKGVEYAVPMKDSDGNITQKREFRGTVDHIVQKDGLVKLVVNVSGYIDPMKPGADKFVASPAGTTATISAAEVSRIG